MQARPWVIALSSVVLAACAAAPAVQAAPTDPVRYHLSIPDPASQYVAVEVHLPEVPGRSVSLSMPAWTPGSYKIRDFARHVYDFEAASPSGRPLPWHRRDKHTWVLEHRGAAVVVRYRVFAGEESVRTSHVDDTHASLQGTSLLVYTPRLRAQHCELTLELPPGWEVHGALDAAGPQRFTAPDYDALVDAPLELGTPEVRQFEVQGTPFEYVLRGGAAAHVDIERLTHDTRHIVAALARDMGGLPMPRYVFITAINEQGGGGLEHDNSTLMMLAASTFHGPRGYLRAAELTAHEFFHAWNVRRIRDDALRPYDYLRETPTTLLWFHEGFTEAVEKLTILRAGLRSPAEFLEDLADAWTTYVALPGRNYSPLDELSRDAWIKAYQPAPNHPNVAVSYYDKGKFVGLALDLEIRLRAASRGREGDLMGVFRRLMTSHGRPERGLQHRDIVAAASAEAGEDMGWFFERFVLGTDEIPWPELVAQLGVEVRAQTPAERAATASDAERFEAQLDRTYAGWDLRGLRVANVHPNAPAARAGVMRDDEIIAVNGLRARDALSTRVHLAHAGPGSTVQLHVFRDGRLHTLALALEENPHRTYRFKLRNEAALSPEVLALRERWLRSRASESP